MKKFENLVKFALTMFFYFSLLDFIFIFAFAGKLENTAHLLYIGVNMWSMIIAITILTISNFFLSMPKTKDNSEKETINYFAYLTWGYFGLLCLTNKAEEFLGKISFLLGATLIIVFIFYHLQQLFKKRKNQHLIFFILGETIILSII